MRCDQFREATSAAIDGEPVGAPMAVLEHHRRGCPACTAWESDAETLTRRLRLRPAERLPPDLTDSIMAAVVRPGQRLRRRVVALRWGLLLTAVGQLAVAVPAAFGDSMGMAMSLHASHESAAWNAAVGLALAFVARRPTRVGGVLTVLGPFVGLLALLSAIDVAAGRVGVERLTTHLGALIGVLLLGGLAWTRRGLLPDDPVPVAFPAHRPADLSAVAAEPPTAPDSPPEPGRRGVA